MKKVLALTALATSVVLWTDQASAITEAQRQAMKRCMEQEQGKPDSSRGGISALEFCAAVVASGDY